MTKSSLNPVQRQTVEVIESLGFGVIEHLLIGGGMPCYDPPPRIVQTIKLDSEPQRKPGNGEAGLTLKLEFEALFNELTRLKDGVVNLEVRHGLPFKLTVERQLEALL